MEVTDHQRRLAAIVAADVVGYSRLMQDDDQATLRTLTERRALFAALVDAGGGRIVNAPGDSVLAEFASVVAAVQCAVDVQRAMREANAVLPESRRMLWRIGVDLGDVLADSAGIYGDGVNIASRLESLAAAGGICVSQSVRDQVGHRLALVFDDRGDHSVKNIAQPLRVFHLADAQAPAASAAPVRTPPPMPGRPWVAVLPFTNMSGDPDQEYFADGMVEEITTALARTEQFYVIARNSSFVYKGRAVDIKQVGRDLGVRYVLEGSVRRAGNRIRITGQLIDADSGGHVWADRFDGALEDVFDLQDRITEAVVWAIAPHVLRAEIERSRVKPASNLQAYDLLLRAVPKVWPGATKAQLDEASALIERALVLDPGYALAKATGAFACMHRLTAGQGDVQDIRTGLRLSDEALTAHQDNPATLALAALGLAGLGLRVFGVRVMGFRYDEALRAIDRALALSPNLFVVQYAAGMIGLVVGEADAANAHFERAMRLSPLDPAMSALILGTAQAHLLSGNHALALDAAQRALRESPGFALAHRAIVVALGALGRSDEAKAAAQQLLELAPQFTVSRYLNVTPIKDAARRTWVADLLRAAGVPK